MELRRSQDPSEDDQLEVNPFAFVDEEINLRAPSNYQFLRTTYSAHYFQHVLQNPFYMGMRFRMINDFTLLAGRRHKSLIRYPPIQTEIPVGVVLQENLSVQSFEPQQVLRPGEPKLLDMSKYIMSRIYDIAESIALDRDDPNDTEIRFTGSIRDIDDKKAVEENIETFLYNNTWTFYSDDRSEELTILCPMFSLIKDDATQETLYMMKFLRINTSVQPNTIYPYIYMVPIRNIRDSLLQIRVTTGGMGELRNDITIYMMLGQPHHANDVFFRTYSFYNPDTLVPANSEFKEIEFPLDNPNDCVVVSMFMCGLLPQPDMTRYHNMFRFVKKTYDPATNSGSLENVLSYGYTPFVNQINTRRIINFYNREDVNRPLKSIKPIRVYLPGSNFRFDPNNYDRATFDNVVRFRGYDLFKVKDKDGFYMAGYKLNYNPTNNIMYLKSLLNAFGCNQQNSFFPLTVYGHQLLLYYDGSEYIMYDPQVKEQYKLTDFNHPNFYSGGVLDKFQLYIEFFVIETTRYSQREIRVPEMVTLFEYFRQTHSYSGDIYPIVRQAINRYIVDMKAGRYQLDYSDRIQLKYIDFLENPFGSRPMDILKLSYDKINYEEITESLRYITDNKLLLLRHPTPSISFKKVQDMEGVLNKAVQNLTSLSTLREIRNFSKEFLNENYDLLQQSLPEHGWANWFTSWFIRYNKDYTITELQDFLYSRPIFVSFLKEYTDKYPLLERQTNGEVIYRLVTYLQRQVKPILGVNRIFSKILDIARRNGVEVLIVRYFNLLKTRNLESIIRVSTVIAENLNPMISRFFRPSEDQIAEVIYNTLENLVNRVKQRKLRLLDEAKSTAIANEARHYILYKHKILVRDVNEFIRLEKERQLEEYKQEYERENQARASAGLPLEYPDQEVIDELVQPTEVTGDLIKQAIENLRKDIKKPEPDEEKEREKREAQLRRLRSIGRLTQRREEKVLKLSYINSYISNLIENTYEDVYSQYFRIPLESWPERMKQVVIATLDKNRLQFVAEVDRITALEVFTYILNIVKTTRTQNNYDLEDYYLGKK